MDSIGQRIRHIRKSYNLTQKEFADSLRVSAPFISELESDSRVPSNSLALLIELIYGFRSRWLILGEGESTINEIGNTDEPKIEKIISILRQNPSIINTVLDFVEERAFLLALKKYKMDDIIGQNIAV